MTAAPKRGSRSIGFDFDVRYFARLLRQVQVEHAGPLRAMVVRLNQVDGGPHKGPWTYSVLRRMLIRGAELGLLDPPRSQGEAGRNRVRRSRSNSAPLRTT